MAQRLTGSGRSLFGGLFSGGGAGAARFELMAHDVGLNPTRAAVLDVLAEWGAPLSIGDLRSE